MAYFFPKDVYKRQVLNDAQLRQEWENELTEMRERIKKMRHLFVQLLKEYGAEQDFSFIMEQNGMFSFSGLSPEQVDRLKEEFAIYAVRSGPVSYTHLIHKIHFAMGINT